MVDLAKLSTESQNENTVDLDIMTPLQIARTMNDEDKKVAEAIEKVLPDIATAIKWGSESLKKGGRIIYMGAGTSGRLGVLDAVECPPTFGVSPDVVVGLMAGGERAFVRAVEGAEDSHTLCEEELKNAGLTSKDLVVGLAASGRTPYVIYGLRYAKNIGARTVSISCNKNSEIGNEAELAIEAVTGAEVLTGSTRLKAGTAQKMILNMISTGSMVSIGKVYKNYMVDVQQTNEKLHVRAENIVMDVTGVSREKADEKLRLADGKVKTAIVMILKSCDCSTADELILRAKGHVRKAIR